MITNEVALLPLRFPTRKAHESCLRDAGIKAVAHTDRWRMDRVTIFARSPSESVLVRLGNLSAMEPQIALEVSDIDSALQEAQRDAASNSTSKKLRRRFVGWRDFATPMETSSSFIKGNRSLKGIY